MNRTRMKRIRKSKNADKNRFFYSQSYQTEQSQSPASDSTKKNCKVF